MRSFRSSVVTLLVAVAVVAGGAAGAADIQPSVTDSVAYSLAPADDVLYSQLDEASGSVFLDQAFEPFLDYASSEGADDFVVSAEEGWDVRTLNTPGERSLNGDPVLFVSVTFYADADGTPGTPVEDCEFPAITDFTENLGDLSIQLACDLPPGHYWFSQQVRLNYYTGGQHFWATRWSALNHPAVWRNPGGEFGYPDCLDWGPAAAACGMEGEDFLFELLGSIGGEPEPVPALGPLGAIAMLLAVGAAGAYLVRRRSR